MKRIFFIFTTLLFCSQTPLAQQPTEISVSMKTPEGKFIGQVAGGGLDATANAVTAKQTFVLVDLNGGKVADGDKIIIKMDASQWHEDKEKSVIHRVPSKGAKIDECTFTLHIKDKLVYLETPSGMFVKVDNVALIGAKDKGEATLFDVQAAAPVAQPTAYTMALKLKNGDYIGMVAGGGMSANAKEISTNQIFQLIDLNGGQLSNGDSVKIIFGQPPTISQWHEDTENNKIHRIPSRGAKDDGCIFKILVVGQNILLQATSGKYVAASADGSGLTTTDKKDDTSLFTAIPNPTPVVK